MLQYPYSIEQEKKWNEQKKACLLRYYASKGLSYVRQSRNPELALNQIRQKRGPEVEKMIRELMK